MNIFILDTNFKNNAEYYCDQHLVKMILESAQILCTVSHMKGVEATYKPTHKNHPCVQWVAENGSHWDLLVELSTALNDEYKKRFNHSNNHKSFDVISQLTKPMYHNNDFKGIFCSVTDEVRRTGVIDTIMLYREYYKNKSKEINMRWTGRVQPHWM